MTFNSKIVILCFQAEAKEPRDNKEVSTPDDLELELENLEISDDPLELEGNDEAEDLTKKLLDEQGELCPTGVTWFVFLHKAVAQEHPSFSLIPVFPLLPSQHILGIGFRIDTLHIPYY